MHVMYMHIPEHMHVFKKSGKGLSSISGCIAAFECIIIKQLASELAWKKKSDFPVERR